MFDFLNSEAWWMETIISAIITAGATILSAILLYHQDVTDIRTAIFSAKDNREGTADRLSKEHEGLSKEHNRLEEGQKEIRQKVDAVKDILMEDRTEEEKKFASLTDRGKDILHGIDTIKMLGEELKNQQERIQSLSSEVSRLRDENLVLKNENLVLKNKIEEDKELIRDLKDELRELNHGPELML